MAFFNLFKKKTERSAIEEPAQKPDLVLTRRESALSEIVLRYPGLVDSPSVYGGYADRAWRAISHRDPDLSESEALEKVLVMLHARILIEQGGKTATQRAEESARKRAAVLSVALKKQETEKAALKQRAKEEERWNADAVLARRKSALSEIVLRYPGLADSPLVYGEFADRAWNATYQRNPDLSESEALEKVLVMLHSRILLVQGQNVAALRTKEESARKRATVALKNQEAEKAALKQRAKAEGLWIADEVPAENPDVVLARRESALSEIVLRYPGLLDKPSVYGEFADRAWRATFKRNPDLSESEALEKVLVMLHARILLVQGQYTASLRAEEKLVHKRAAAALEKTKSDRAAAKLKEKTEKRAIADEQKRIKYLMDAPKREERKKRKEEKEEAARQESETWYRENKPTPLHITDWDKAEENAERWMRFMGFGDVRRTGAGADGGIDVVATGAAAQVKREGYDTGAPALQGFRGAAWNYDVRLFFSSSGYTKQAVIFANSVSMELFIVGPYGEVTGVNQVAFDRLEQATPTGRDYA